MRLPIFFHTCLAGAAVLALPGLHAAESSSVVSKVFGKASAAPNTALPAGTAFTTGPRSKSEIALPRGIVRVGQKAELETTPKGLTLRQGVTLVASEPGRFRKTIEVRAPGYRLKVKGTVQVSFDPGHSLKVAVLEGSVTVALDSLMGEFEELRPGQMLVINPSDNRLPEPVEIDIQRLVATSALTGGEFGALPTAGNIKAGTGAQGLAYARGDLAATPFLLRGTDTELQLRQIRRLEAPQVPDPARVEQTIFQLVNDLDNPNANVEEKPFLDLAPLDTFGNQNITRSGARTALLRVNMNSQFAELPPGSFNFVQTAAPRLFGTITVDPDVFTNQTGILEFSVKDSVSDGPLLMQIDPGTNITTPPNVGLRFLTLGLTATGATLQAGNATSDSEPLEIRAAARNIRFTGSTLRGGTATIAGGSLGGGTQNIRLDSTKVSGHRGVNVGLASVRTGINIRNSSELAAFAAGINVFSKGASISITDSMLKDTKAILIDALDVDDASAAGIVTIRNAQLAADAIRIRGFSPSGDALIIDGSTFNAAQFIKLYAEGVSTLRFRNNVSLNTPLAIIAGKIVEVDSGGAVSISGKGRVLTDTDNYNKAGFGTINAGGGLTKGSHGSRENFNQTASP